MKYTKEELDKLAQNPFAQHLASLMGFNLKDLIEQEKLKCEESDKLENVFENLDCEITNTLNKMVEDGVLECEETVEDGVIKKYYHTPEETKETESIKSSEKQKEYVKPEAKEQPFLMSAEQLEKFINNYHSLIEAEKKLAYLFGVEFNDGNSGFGFPSKLNEIIWNFVRIIFGDENAEDIADYIFGNSNFDNVKSLYEELT